MDFIKNKNVFNESEFKYYNMGQEKAYCEMEKDFELSINEFIDKYESIFKKNDAEVGEATENGTSEQEKLELLIGYDNTLIETLELLNPKYRFGAEE